MRSPSQVPGHKKLIATAACAAMAGGFVLFARAARPDNPPAETVGTIDGADISVHGPMSAQVVNGEIKTVLRSGSDVQVKSGRAVIELVEGGRIAICGPAHLSVLKSGAALTVALDSGTIHAEINQEPALNIYTAQIQAKPISIGGGTQETLVGLDAHGAMCVRASNGAVRLEQQLTGQSILLPQGGDVFLQNGQLDGLKIAQGQCACELPTAKTPAPSAPEVSLIATSEEVKKKKLDLKADRAPNPPAPIAAKEEPIYQVNMPPLRFDANAKVQDEPDPRLIVLVRRVRVRPTLIFEGRVEGDPVVVASALPPATPVQAPAAAATLKPPAPPPSESMVDRVKTFLRKLWTPSS